MSNIKERKNTVDTLVKEEKILVFGLGWVLKIESWVGGEEKRKYWSKDAVVSDNPSNKLENIYKNKDI